MDKKKEVTSVSYIGKPIDYTAMFVTKKAEKLIANLKGSKGCMVFAENGTNVPSEILEKNNFIFTDNPQRDYTAFAKKIADERDSKERKMKYSLVDGLYYVGENAVIGKGAIIEPGAVIGHNVIIGENALIKAGAVIKNAIIGDNFIICENSVIGTNAFTTAVDEEGNNIKIPALGKIVIGNNVEIGALNSIARSSSLDTIISDNVKTDDLTHIAHDCSIEKNVIITSGVITGGFVTLGEKSWIGMNSTIKNRKNIGEHTLLGMGANVVKDIDSNVIAVGNPAKYLKDNH